MRNLNRTAVIVLLMLLAGCTAPVPRLQGGVAPLWQVKVGNRGDSTIHAPVAVSDGLVYVTAMDKVPGLYPWSVIYYLQALSAEDGSFRWHSEQAGSNLTTPVVEDGIVYVGSIRAGIYALDAISGQAIWFLNVTDPVSTPVVRDGKVYLSSEGRNPSDPNEPRENKLVTIDSKTGQWSWSVLLDRSFHPKLAPLVTSTAVYFVNGPKLYFADPQTGNTRLVFEAEDDFITEPALHDGTIYITSHSDLMAIDADSGALLWSLPIDEGMLGSMLFSDDVAYLSVMIGFSPPLLGTGRVVAVDINTQNELWHFDFNSPIYSLVDDDDTIYFVSGSQMRGINKTTGRQVWRFKAKDTLNAPTIADGIIYVGDRSGQLYALPAAEKPRSLTQ